MREISARRVYEIKELPGDIYSLRLSDQIVDLGRQEYSSYNKVVDWIFSNQELNQLPASLGLAKDSTEMFLHKLEKSGLLYRRVKIPAGVTGSEFHRDYFSKVLPSWLIQAFDHPFWERMTSGRGSARLFSGWMIELYHYTLNANRHMSLSCAFTQEKALKTLRAKHYAEEWNHYHYFIKSLKALGFTVEAIEKSTPLPMTLALSNFMRQAAREDILAYSICSAVLEGTTTDRGTYNPYYEKSAELYHIPKAAIAPIYAHLDLDIQYGHSDLFADILQHVDHISAQRAGRILDYGHQLVEHIWLWTECIEKYYELDSNPVPRSPFDLNLD